MPVVKVKPPLKATVALARLLVIVKDPALTAPLKVVPPELVMVRVPIPEVLVPAIVALDTAPVFNSRLYVAPVTAPILNVPALVVAAVLMVVFAPKVIGPKLMASSLLAIVPFKVEALGAVAVKPPLKVKVLPLAPKAKVPVLLKVTALVIVPVLALSARL